MRSLITAAVLAVVVSAWGAPEVSAGEPRSFAGMTPLTFGAGHSARGLTGRAMHFDSRNGSPIPSVTRLHPVVGSVQRIGHRPKYSATMFNPVLGTFGTHVFRR